MTADEKEAELARSRERLEQDRTCIQNEAGLSIKCKVPEAGCYPSRFSKQTMTSNHTLRRSEILMDLQKMQDMERALQTPSIAHAQEIPCQVSPAQARAKRSTSRAGLAHNATTTTQQPLTKVHRASNHAIGVPAQAQAPASTAAGDQAWRASEATVTNLLVDVYYPSSYGWYTGRVEYFDAKTGQHCINFDDGDTDMVRLADSRVRLASVGPASSESVGAEAVGRQIEVFRPEQHAWYVGKVCSFDPQSGQHQIAYDDGVSEQLQLAGQIFRLVERDLAEAHKSGRHAG